MRAPRSRRFRDGRAHGPTLPGGVREAVRSSGEPLNAEVLALMQSGFGHDFSRVRVHSDGDAARSAHALGARAYTVGEDVVFGAGACAPSDVAGRSLIAHELAHVVQQEHTGGTPSRPVSSPTDRSEGVARSAAERVTAGGSALGALGGADARVSCEVEPGWQDGGQGQGGGWSIDPSPPPAPATNVLQEFDVDRRKGGKPWNLDKLTRQIGEALAADQGRYIEVVGYYDVSEEQGAGDARDAAKKRADVVRRALLQWIPTLKGRLRVTIRDRDLWRESGGDPTRRQVGVEWGPFGLVGGAASPLLADPGATPGVPGLGGAAKAGVPPEESLKAFFGDGIAIGKDIVSLSIKGITRTLYKEGAIKATLTAGWTATATFKLAIQRWNFSTSLSPTGSWEVRLSFPRETWLPDATRLKAIMDRGSEAALAIGKTATDPAFYQLLERAQKLESIDDFKAIGDRISPYVDPIRYTIEAAQGIGEYKGGPSFGLSAGSGTAPGGRTQTPAESAAGAPKGAYVQGVLTWTF